MEIGWCSQEGWGGARRDDVCRALLELTSLIEPL